MSDARRRKTVNAVVALLDAMPEAWVQDVLQRLNVRGAVVMDQPAPTRRRVCGICTLPYPLCRSRWSDDHDWEGPEPRDQEDGA